MAEAMITTLPWEPILSDTLLANARAALDAIIEDVRNSDAVVVHSANTLSEFGLLFGYMSQIDNRTEWEQLTGDYLERSIEKISGAYGGWTGLYGGISGVGWSVEHLMRLLEGNRETVYSEDADDPIEAIDAYLIRTMESGGWHGPYDLISGPVGFGTYFLERLPRPSAQRGIDLCLDEIEKRHEKSWGGTTWHTPPQEIPYHQLKHAPDGYYNLGVAHGIPGVIKFLSEAVTAGIERPGLGEMLVDSVRWLLARERPPQSLSRYSSWFVPGLDAGDSRLGWCYGDLGVGAILFGVGKQIGRSDWQVAGENLLLRCTEWQSEEAIVRDAPLCHGAIGVAHIFNRAYQSTRNERFKHAANSWYERGLEFRKPGEGVGGFFSYTPDKDPIWEADYSFLSGGVGVALALISAMYPIEPNWDRMLLISDSVPARKVASVAA